jgi:uncharacterized damage-inducible protein DinB
MIRLSTIRELFVHNDWGNDKILGLAETLSDAQLDQPFEMGQGSLRKTLNHLGGAEFAWLRRWSHGADRDDYREDPAGVGVAQFREEFRRIAAERNEFLAAQTDATLANPRTYRNFLGQIHTYPLGDMLLHVANHGVHTRAQAVNMLKRVGAAEIKPGLDYIYMKLAQPGGGTRDAAPTDIEFESVRVYYQFADWARDQVQSAAAKLTDGQLDREFPIGLGTLRKTLLHIRFAEQWWLENWLHGPGRPFPELDANTPVAELMRLFDQTARERNAYFASLAESDARRFVEARPRPDVHRAFPLAVVMLQLCCHGTHHRAQALNMLRHVGGTVPELDVLTMHRALRRGPAS